VLPRFVFAKLEEFDNWIKKHVTAERYEAYATKSYIVLVPLKSTKPVKYAYIELGEENLKKVKQNLETIGVSVFNVKEVEWKTDLPPGVKIPLV